MSAVVPAERSEAIADCAGSITCNALVFDIDAPFRKIIPSIACRDWLRVATGGIRVVIRLHLITTTRHTASIVHSRGRYQVRSCVATNNGPCGAILLHTVVLALVGAARTFLTRTVERGRRLDKVLAGRADVSSHQQTRRPGEWRLRLVLTYI